MATKVVVREQLLKTLKGVEDDQNFIWFLKWVFFKNGIPQTALKEIYMRTFLRGISSETLVDQLMEKCGLRCLEMIKEVFVNMNRSDLVKMLETSSGSEGKMKSEKCSLETNAVVFEDVLVLYIKMFPPTSIFQKLLETERNQPNKSGSCHDYMVLLGRSAMLVATCLFL